MKIFVYQRALITKFNPSFSNKVKTKLRSSAGFKDFWYTGCPEKTTFKAF